MPTSTEDATGYGNAVGRVEYKGILPSVDLKYTVLHEKIKEDIILSENTGLTSYIAEYKVENGRRIDFKGISDGEWHIAVLDLADGVKYASDSDGYFAAHLVKYWLLGLAALVLCRSVRISNFLVTEL